MGFTFFFRDSQTLSQLIEQTFKLFPGSQNLKIWDAGSSNGAEPYTLAIMLAELLGKDEFMKRITIYASDKNISSGFDKIIQSGIYDISQIIRMPDGYLEKYFTQVDDTKNYQIVDFIKDHINFVHHDLTSLKPFETNFNMILCKNVIMHILPEQRVDVVKMYHDVLVTNGTFCTEQTQNMPEGTEHLFEKLVANANVYKKV